MAANRLSTESWARVFDYLSDCRRDVANGRLVCKLFAAVGSEYLIPRIVIAKRSESLQRAWDVLEHPVFSVHVKELVYDSSHYDPVIATDFSTYARVSSAYPERTYLREGLKGSKQSFAGLLERIPRRSNVDDLLPSRGFGPQGGLEFYSGFIEYSKQWLDYRNVVSENLHFTTLRHALSQLPKLRWIYFTDFRHLAAPGELYLELSRRLFGDVIEPGCPSLEISDEIIELLNVWKIIKEEPKARIHGFQIGGHQYEDWAEEKCLGNMYLHNPNSSPALSFNFLDLTFDPDHSNNDFASDILPVLSAIIPQRLKYLRLPVTIPVDEILDEQFDPDSEIPGSSLNKLLHITMPTLVSLELWASATFTNDQGDDDPIYIRTAQAFLKVLLEGLASTSLRYIEFGKWELPGRHVLQQFFSKYSSTLKEVRLLQSNFHEDPFPLGEWVGEHMNLIGVEIDCSCWRPRRYEIGNEDVGNNGADNTLREGRSDGKMPTDYNKLMWWLKKGNFQLEELWLGGRHNYIDKHSRLPSFELFVGLLSRSTTIEN